MRGGRISSRLHRSPSKGGESTPSCVFLVTRGTILIWKGNVPAALHHTFISPASRFTFSLPLFLHGKNLTTPSIVVGGHLLALPASAAHIRVVLIASQPASTKHSSQSSFASFFTSTAHHYELL